MEMQGEARIPAPKAVVWEALNDPEALKAAIKGCEELSRDGDNRFAAKVRAKVGPVSARFSGKVELTDIDPPNGYRIQGEGSGGAAGFAKGGAVVSLEDDNEGGVILKYQVDANVGGKLAQIGARLIDGAAKKMADDFFTEFSAIAAARAAQPPAEPTGAPATTDAPKPTADPEPVAAAIASAAPPPEVDAPMAPRAADPAADPAADAPLPREAPEPIPAPAATPAPDAPQAPASGGVPMLVWVAGVGLAVAAVLYALF